MLRISALCNRLWPYWLDKITANSWLSRNAEFREQFLHVFCYYYPTPSFALCEATIIPFLLTDTDPRFTVTEDFAHNIANRQISKACFYSVFYWWTLFSTPPWFCPSRRFADLLHYPWFFSPIAGCLFYPSSPLLSPMHMLRWVADSCQTVFFGGFPCSHRHLTGSIPSLRLSLTKIPSGRMVYIFVVTPHWE